MSAPEGAGPSAESAAASPAEDSGTKKKKGGRGPEEAQGLAWSPETGWTGFTGDLWDELALAYPACDIRRQLLAMEQWLKANPTRAHKSNWRKFVTNWLAKEQDRGGDLRGKPKPAWAGAVDPVEQTHETAVEAPPEGWERAMVALWGEQWREFHAAWHPMLHSDKAKVRAWLAAEGKEAA